MAQPQQNQTQLLTAEELKELIKQQAKKSDVVTYRGITGKIAA
jgi:hypothetical protein